MWRICATSESIYNQLTNAWGTCARLATQMRSKSFKLKNLRQLIKVCQKLDFRNALTKQDLKTIFNTVFRFLSTKLQLPVTYTNKKMHSPSVASQLEQFVTELADKELSFLSPKILNVLPAKQQSGPQQLFSPTILSFQEEGLVPLPKILSVSF